MTELEVEDRLRTDAARHRDVPPPSLHDALDVVFADEPIPRRGHAPALAAAAAAIVVGVAATALALGRGDSSEHRATGPQPGATAPLTYPADVPITSGSQRLFSIAGVRALLVLVDAADPRTLHVVIDRATQIGACTLYDPRLGVVERADYVELQLSGWVYLPTSSGKNPVRSCTSGHAAELTVTLPSPLGTRTVYADSQHAWAVPTYKSVDFPARAVLQRVGYLPIGLTSRSGDPRVAQTYIGSGEDRVVIVANSPRSEVDALPVVGHVKVGTAQATVSGSATEACVTWPARAGLRSQVCSTGPSRLNVDELVKVAEGAR